jgi:CubicO group peptidase (beta-lactamase class C family)
MSGHSEIPKIDEIAQREINVGHFAGVVIRAVRHGKLEFERAYGYAIDIPGLREHVVPSTRFDIASLTKIFTTTAVLRLATFKKIDLDTTLCDTKLGAVYCRDRPLLAKAFAKTTPRMLLSHSSGFHYWYPFYAAKACARGGDFADALEEVFEKHPPRAVTIYSDLNFMILGKLIESATGKALDVALCDLVCNPLGLAESDYKGHGHVAASEFGNRIERKMVEETGLEFTSWRPEDKPFIGEPDDGNCHYYFGGIAGHAGIFSTVRDACGLGRLYLDPEGHFGYIDPALIAEARKDQGNARGLGFQLGELYPWGGFGHTGFTGSYLYLSAERDIAIAIFANRLHVESPTNINEFRKETTKALLEAL